MVTAVDSNGILSGIQPIINSSLRAQVQILLVSFCHKSSYSKDVGGNNILASLANTTIVLHYSSASVSRSIS